MAPYQNGEKANGTEVVSNSSHASSTATADEGKRLASQTKPKPSLLKLKPTKADKQGVANAFERYGQVMHARVKPLPNQGSGPAGGGTFYETKRWGKLRTDLKTLRTAGKLARELKRSRSGIARMDYRD